MNPALEENKDFLHVLIIGNGFDLAHGLETRYTDFLRAYIPTWKDCVSLWFRHFTLIYMQNNIRLQNVPVKKRVENYWFNLERDIYSTVYNPDSNDNTLNMRGMIQYMSTNNERTKEIYNHMDAYGSFNIYTLLKNLADPKDNSTIQAVKALYEKVTPLETWWYKGNTQSHVYGLRSFIDKFSDYLSQTVLKQIEELTHKPKFLFRLKELGDENTHSQKHTLWVLNFNYTPTFQKLYEPTLTKRAIKVHHCHIHGALGEGELVLGCQSFPKNKENKENKLDPAWNVFTKHHQRHRYGTIDKYQELLKKLSHFKGEVTFHILGHSLDQADHAILKHALCSSHNTTVQDSFISVYYHDEEAHLRLINNITDIIEEESVMARVRFIDQHDPDRGILRHIHET